MAERSSSVSERASWPGSSTKNMVASSTPECPSPSRCPASCVTTLWRSTLGDGSPVVVKEASWLKIMSLSTIWPGSTMRSRKGARRVNEVVGVIASTPSENWKSGSPRVTRLSPSSIWASVWATIGASVSGTAAPFTPFHALNPARTAASSAALNGCGPPVAIAKRIESLAAQDSMWRRVAVASTHPSPLASWPAADTVGQPSAPLATPS